MSGKTIERFGRFNKRELLILNDLFFAYIVLSFVLMTYITFFGLNFESVFGISFSVFPCFLFLVDMVLCFLIGIINHYYKFFNLKEILLICGTPMFFLLVNIFVELFVFVEPLTGDPIGTYYDRNPSSLLFGVIIGVIFLISYILLEIKVLSGLRKSIASKNDDKELPRLYFTGLKRFQINEDLLKRVNSSIISLKILFFTFNFSLFSLFLFSLIFAYNIAEVNSTIPYHFSLLTLVPITIGLLTLFISLRNNLFKKKAFIILFLTIIIYFLFLYFVCFLISSYRNSIDPFACMLSSFFAFFVAMFFISFIIKYFIKQFFIKSLEYIFFKNDDLENNK